MYTFDDVVLFAVNQGLFTSCVATPKNEYNVLLLVGNQLDNAVGEPRPTALRVRIRLVSPNGKGSVQ